MPEVVQEGQKREIVLDHYPDRFLTCRALQHTWVPMGLPWLEIIENSQVVYERLRCTRCDMQRVDQRTPYGRLLRRHYRQEAGYRLGSDANSKSIYVHERFQRILGSGFENRVEQTA